jgi:hypothetical protein
VRQRGLSRPVLTALIAGGVTLIAAIAVAAGLLIMQAEGRETGLSASLIGIGLFVFIMGGAATILFVWSAVVIRNIRDGRNLIARWTVAPDELDRFRAGDAARSALGDEYRSIWSAPEISPPEGLDVRVAPDAVLIGEDYVGLSTTGLNRFSAVQRIVKAPAALEFRLHMAEARGATVQRLVSLTSLLRVPASHSAPDEVAKALDHFERVLRREIIVNPHWWTVRIRIGLWTIALGAAAALGGWLWPKVFPDPDSIAQAVMAAGILFALGGVALAAASYSYYRAQMGR